MYIAERTPRGKEPLMLFYHLHLFRNQKLAGLLQQVHLLALSNNFFTKVDDDMTLSAQALSVLGDLDEQCGSNITRHPSLSMSEAVTVATENLWDDELQHLAA
ncbi:MAG: hypothetical protein MRY49_02735 [Candidatus Pacebacteria bacterium]|nr:hypothetical protein [Candidatus Paceibacterota bacterium]